MAFDSIKDGTIANDPMFIVVPCLMAVFGFFFMRKFIWDLADEVFDGGDFLLVKYRGAEDKILLANIMNVSASASTNPPRITLRLIKPSKLGNEISFSPDAPLSLNPFAKNPIAEELIVRVHMAKATHAV